MYIPIILGTARKGRQSEKVTVFMLEQTRKRGLDSEIIDVRDYRIEATDNSKEPPEAKKLAEKIKKADAIVIVAPEYNYSYPGELKMMLDMLYEEYARKPVGICCVSAGPFGGARMMQHLKALLVALRMVPAGELYFPSVYGLFDENGKINDKTYEERAMKFFDELMLYANMLNNKS